MANDRSGKQTPEAYRKSLASVQALLKEAEGDAAKIKPHLKELKENPEICGAFIRSEGTICIERPYVAEDGRTNNRCWTHGGASTGPISAMVVQSAQSKLHPKAYQVYAINMERFRFTAAENIFYIDTMNEYINEYNLDTVNIILLDRALRNFFMNGRKEMAQANETVPESRSNQDFDTKALRYFQALGFDRKFTQSVNNSENTQKIDLAQVFTLQPGPKSEVPKSVIDSDSIPARQKEKLESEQARLKSGLEKKFERLPDLSTNITHEQDEDELDNDAPTDEEY